MRRAPGGPSRASSIPGDAGLGGRRARGVPCAAETCRAPQRGHGARAVSPRRRCGNAEGRLGVRASGRARASGPRAPRAPAPRSPPPRGSPRSHWHSARVARAANPIWSGRPGKARERVTGRWGLADSGGAVPSARPPRSFPAAPRGPPTRTPAPSERREGKTAPGAAWRQQVAGLGGFGGDDPAWKGKTERPDRRSPPSPPGRPYLSGRTGN